MHGIECKREVCEQEPGGGVGGFQMFVDDLQDEYLGVLLALYAVQGRQGSASINGSTHLVIEFLRIFSIAFIPKEVRATGPQV